MTCQFNVHQGKPNQNKNCLQKMQMGSILIDCKYFKIFFQQEHNNTVECLYSICRL